MNRALDIYADLKGALASFDACLTGNNRTHTKESFTRLQNCREAFMVALDAFYEFWKAEFPPDLVEITPEPAAFVNDANLPQPEASKEVKALLAKIDEYKRRLLASERNEETLRQKLREYEKAAS